MWEQLWGFENLEPPFADMRVITSSWESLQHGFDPQDRNPFDPWKRAINYPRIWVTPGYLGLTSRSTVALGFLLWAGFFLSLWLLLDKSRARVLFAAPLLFGPAVMMGLERGNIDLLIFSMTVPTALLLPRRVIGSAFLIFLGFALKIYPAALAALVLRGDRKPREIFFGLCAAIGLLGLVDWADLMLVRANTPSPAHEAYGIDCLYLRCAPLYPGLGFVFRLTQWLMLIAPFAAARFVHFGKIARPGFAERAFFSGALIYCFTFLLGSNFDYRLLLLLLCVPLLSLRAHWTAPYARAGILTMMIVASWGMYIEVVARYVFGEQLFAFLIVQAAKYLLFVCLGAMPLQERWGWFSGIRPKAVAPVSTDASVDALPQSA